LADESPKLPDNLTARLFFPFPDPVDEGLSPKLMSARSFLGQFPLNDVLCGDSRVVGPGHPEGAVGIHPFVPDQSVLKRVVERMPHVK
jgi:hypothetical protein